MIDGYTIGANGRPTIPKAPAAERYYGVDLTDLLDGAAIAAASATLDQGLSQVGAVIFDSTTIRVKVAGGTLEKTLGVHFTWTDSNGEKDARSVYLSIETR